MIPIKRFQRTLIILLAAINSLFYCSSQSYPFVETLSITFISTGIIALLVFGYGYIRSHSRRKKAKLKS
ncbi:hypothetical protein D3C87_13750 [compost metagenome]